MKLSVSLPGDIIDFIDSYATSHGVESRSGVVERSLHMLRMSELGVEYEAAWSEWFASDAELWDATVASGLSRT